MSQTRDPHAVQPHVGKCFDAIKRIKFGEKKQAHDIQGFNDPGGEVVLLSEEVKAQGPVEGWLLAFEKRYAFYIIRPREKIIHEVPCDRRGRHRSCRLDGAYPAQVVIAIDQVMWTAGVTIAIRKVEGNYQPNEDEPAAAPRKEATQEFLDFSLKQIDAMVAQVRLPLNKQQRTLLGAMLTIDVHARDVVRTLVKKEVHSL